jgi:hypothetical protein
VAYFGIDADFSIADLRVGVVNNGSMPRTRGRQYLLIHILLFSVFCEYVFFQFILSTPTLKLLFMAILFVGKVSQSAHYSPQHAG